MTLETRRNDLAEQLESSIRAVQTGGAFIPRWQLPHDHDLTDVHAMLDRVIRGQRVMRASEVLLMPTEK